MTTVVRSGMIEDGAFYSQAEAYALFRTPFIGSYVDLAYEPSAEDEPELLPCYGQTVLVADYPALFAKLGIRYGGNGTTTFGIPDWRGRVGAGLDNMGGTSANRLTNQSGGLNGDVLGAAGGAETVTLTTNQIPAHNHPATSSDETVTIINVTEFGSAQTGGGGVRLGTGGGGTLVSQPHDHDITVQNTGGGQAHNNVQPTMTHVRCILAF